ncbi:MAG: hypothetical protein LBI39_02660 [Puniceicoccales bacterium]|jgi:hypothetical protein|nr:hypothetical protein [Puniceicoccales bacterium]
MITLFRTPNGFSAHGALSMSVALGHVRNMINYDSLGLQIRSIAENSEDLSASIYIGGSTWLNFSVFVLAKDINNCIMSVYLSACRNELGVPMPFLEERLANGQ